MKQYKVGDKVRVKTHERNLGVGAYIGGGMTKMCGKVCTISFASNDIYQLKEDKCGFYWCSDNFEPYVVPETKYKPGDVVTVRSDLAAYTTYTMADQTNCMDATEQMVTKAGKKVKIKSVTKTGKYMIEGSIFPWVDGMFVDESKVEPKKTTEPRFKVGDKVRVRKDLILNERYYMNNREHHDSFVGGMKNLMGKVVTIASVGYTYRIKENSYNWVDEMFEPDVVKEEPKKFDWEESVKKWKLVIRGEGDNTTAEYIVNDVKKTAEVHRFFEDQYSVHKAIEAVTQKILPEEKWVVGVKFDGGKKVYDYTTTDNTIKAGDKVVVATGSDSHYVAVTVTWIKTYDEYAKTSKGIELKGIIRKCERGDEPTYYNGKVVCVYRTPGSAYTEGKIYQAVDGKIRIDNGNLVPFERAETFKDLAEKLHGFANFVEIVE
jgi:hypothetical protein